MKMTFERQTYTGWGMLQASLAWQNRAPAAYQLFTNKLYCWIKPDLQFDKHWVKWSQRYTVQQHIDLLQNLWKIKSITFDGKWRSYALMHLMSPHSVSPYLWRVQLTSQKWLQPTQSLKTGCTMMFLINLAQPEWLSVSCSQECNMHVDVVCLQETRNNTHLSSSDEYSLACPPSAVRNHNTCMSFIWLNQSVTNLEEKCKEMRMSAFKFEHIGVLAFLKMPYCHQFSTGIIQCFPTKAIGVTKLFTNRPEVWVWVDLQSARVNKLPLMT